MTRKKIAILFPVFFNGGAEFVTAWMLESLKNIYDVSLFTFSQINFSEINQKFGTSLSKDDIDVRVIHPLLKYLSDPHRYSLMTIRQHLLANKFRKVCEDFDLAISAFNEMDLGKPGIQYIHVPLFAHGNEIARHIFNYPTSTIRTLYQRTCEFLSGYSEERMKKNITITNSQWTADLIKRSFGMDAKILSPMVVITKINTPWEKRENGFIISGRLTPDKNIESAIEIISKVRKVYPDVHLHIVSSGYDSNYRNNILKLCELNAQWLYLTENLSRSEYQQILSQHRYGIHARANETFGITIAEMVCAGCIPFIPDEGGQLEIVGNNPALKFGNIEEAVDKICDVLSSPIHQTQLHENLSTHGNLFTYENFNSKLIFHIEQAMG